MRMEQQWNDTDNGEPKSSEIKLSQCNFIYHKSHTKSANLGLRWAMVLSDCITNKLIRYLHSPSNHSASQKFLHLLWDPKLIYSQGPTTISCWGAPIHTIIPYSCTTTFNIIFPPVPKYSEWTLLFRVSSQKLYALLISHMHATCPTHPRLIQG